MIRFTKDYSAEVNRIVKNYNSKIRRLEKKGTPSYLIPKREYARNLKREYKTISRKELNIKLRELQAFSKRGSEKIIKLEHGRTTEWHYQMIKRHNTRLIRQKKRELKLAQQNLTEWDFETRSIISNLKALLKKLAKPIKERADLSSLNVEYQKEYSPHRKNVFYENFFEALFKDANFINYPKEQLDEIKDYLSRFTPDELMTLSDKSPLISGIFDYYNVNDRESTETLFSELYANLRELPAYL